MAMLAGYVLIGGLLAGRAALPSFALDDRADGVYITGPLLGYYFEPGEAALRPIQGIPGAAILGPPLELGVRLTRAAVSPQHDYVLARVEGEPELALVRPEASPPSLVRIPGALENPDRMVFSPEGTAALLYRDADGAVQVLAGLPGEPSVVGHLTIVADPGAAPALAVSDDAGAILAGPIRGEVTLFTSDGGSRGVLPAATPASIAFLRQRHDAVIADRAERTVYLLRDPAGRRELTVLAREADGVQDPVAVETSWEGRRALVANAEGSVLVVDLTGEASLLIPCPCQTTGLMRLTGNAVFRLDEPRAGPLTVLDADSSEPRVVFIPAAIR